MAVSALQVARAIKDRKPDVDRLGLQKLLYLVQGYHLAMFGRRLFDEELEAWDYGPVVPDVWRQGWLVDAIESGHLPATGDETLAHVLELYGGRRSVDLMRLSHQQAPWKDAYERGRNTVITTDVLAAFFEAMPDMVERRAAADEYRAAAPPPYDPLVIDDDLLVLVEKARANR